MLGPSIRANGGRSRFRRGRRRPDPLVAVTAQLRAWFDADPSRTGRELLERLQVDLGLVARSAAADGPAWPEGLAGRDGAAVLTRLVAGHDSSETTLFYTGLVGSILVLPVAPFVWATPASGPVWLAMAGVAAFGALGHWLLILAHKRAPASIVAPFFYAQLLWATLLGWLVFGEVPDRWTLVGGVIVMSSGLYLLSRERARHKPPSADIPA